MMLFLFSLECFGSMLCAQVLLCVQVSDFSFLESISKKFSFICSVIVEAVKVDSLQRLCSSLEPLLRKIVSHKVTNQLPQGREPALNCSYRACFFTF